MERPQILISAGEPSGEMHAAQLAAALHARTDCDIFGLGGVRMRQAGVEMIADCGEIAVVGISEVIRRLPGVWRIYRQLIAAARLRKPALAILVDFPDFNLRLARRLHAMGVRVLYFISPQVWAWRPGRVHLIKRYVERVLCIFPFEREFYRRAGVPADFVGHPLVGMVVPRKTRAEFAAEFGLDAAEPIVGLLPGSRPSEIDHNLPVMLDACERLRRDGARQFVLAVAPGVGEKHLGRHSRAHLPVVIAVESTYDTLATADCSIVSSGTATVEAALLGAPMVVVYRVSGTTAFLARRMIRTPFFSMVNLIAGRRAVPELVQEDFTADAVAAEILRLLTSAKAREQLKAGLSEVRRKLGDPGAIDRAADLIARLL